MFFRFYILGLLVSLYFVLTSSSIIAFIIFFWFLLTMARMFFYYRSWRKKQALICEYKTLSFCIKSMRRQKHNFKIITFLIRNKALQTLLKKFSILLDDININKKHELTDDFPLYNKVDSNSHVHSPVYSHMSCNLYYSQDNLSDRR